MNTNKLTLMEDPNGFFGYVLAGNGYVAQAFEQGDALVDTDGTLTAHDLVEHGYGVHNIGPVWDEAQAMGAVWHCRGRWGDFNSFASPEESCAADLSRLYPSWLEEGRFMGRWPKRSRTHDHDDAFRSICSIVRSSVRAEGHGSRYLEAYSDFCMVHLRAGYNRACLRWGHDFRSNNQYRAIARALKPLLRFAGEESAPEIILRWGGGEATAKPVEYQYEY